MNRSWWKLMIAILIVMIIVGKVASVIADIGTDYMFETPSLTLYEDGSWRYHEYTGCLPFNPCWDPDHE